VKQPIRAAARLDDLDYHPERPDEQVPDIIQRLRAAARNRPAAPSYRCGACVAYFSRYQCGADQGSGECDCPKCQGYCRCADYTLTTDGHIEKENL